MLTLYTYDLDNNVLSRSNRNGTFSTYTYDANSWVTQLTHSNGAALIAGYAYVYDGEGNQEPTRRMRPCRPSPKPTPMTLSIG